MSKVEFIKGLEVLVNQSSWDNRLELNDFIVADMIYDFLIAMENAKKWRAELASKGKQAN